MTAMPAAISATVPTVPPLKLVGSKAAGDFTSKDEYDAREVQLNRLILSGGHLWNPCAADEKSARAAVDNLAYLVSKQPTQTMRTVEMEQYQQFSTPPHLAYVVAWVANLGPDDTVMEPSAGCGGLLVHAINAKPKDVIANEVAHRRAALLEGLLTPTGYPYRVFREDGEQLHNILPPFLKPTVVLMNPPFSKAGNRLGDAKDAKAGSRHVEQALARLQPGGRLVAILGRGMRLTAPAWAAWWRGIQARHAVLANIGIPGAEYAKYGTRFETRICVIDKTDPAAAPMAVTGDVSSVAALIDVLAPVRALRGGKPAPRPAKIPGSLFEVPRESDAPAPRPSPETQGGAAGAASTPGHGSDAAPVGNAPAIDVHPLAGTGGDVPTPAPAPAPEPPVPGPLTDAIFEAYRPQRLNVPGLRPHPTALVQSAAMASVVPPEPTYRPAIPEFLLESGVLSEAQYEAIVYAGQAFEQRLPPQFIDERLPTGETVKRSVEYRRGFMCGDGTGVGKGREIAGCILDTFLRGERKAVWVSKTPKLLADARRDWEALGGDPAEVFDLRKVKLGEPIPFTKGICFASYATLRTEAQKEPADPWEKRVTRGTLPAHWQGQNDYVQQYVIRAANKADDATWDVISRYRNGDGDHLYRVAELAHGVPNGTTPSKRIIRQCLGFTVAEAPPADDTAKRAKPTRLQQILEWLQKDGPDASPLIAYDESHAMKYAVEIKKK